MCGPILGEHGESRVRILVTSDRGGSSSCPASAGYCRVCLHFVLDGRESTVISPQVI